MKGLYIICGVHGSNRARYHKDLQKFWKFTVSLGAKKSWRTPEVRAFAEGVWLLEEPHLEELENITKKKYCWLLMGKLLSRMRIDIQRRPELGIHVPLQILLREVEGTIAKFTSTVNYYMYANEPEKVEAIQSFTDEFGDRLMEASLGAH